MKLLTFKRAAHRADHITRVRKELAEYKRRERVRDGLLKISTPKGENNKNNKDNKE